MRPIPGSVYEGDMTGSEVAGVVVSDYEVKP